jgi:uncharacterized membrane protein YqiK
VNGTRPLHAQLLEAEHDLHRMGLVLDTLKIQNITDDVGYLNSIGRIRARVRQDAAIAGRARVRRRRQQSLNWCASRSPRWTPTWPCGDAKRILDANATRSDNREAGPGEGDRSPGHGEIGREGAPGCR